MARNDKVQKLLLAKSIQDLQATKESLDKEIKEKEEITSQISTWMSERDSKQAELEELTAKISQYGEAASIIESKEEIIAEANQKNSDLLLQIAELDEQIETKSSELKAIIDKIGNYDSAQEIIDAANTKGEEIIRKAEEEANSKILSCEELERSSKADADKTINEAQSKANDIIKNANIEKDRIVASGNEEANKIKSEANAVLTNAKAESERIAEEAKTAFANAKKDKEEMLADAKSSAESIVNAAKDKRDEYISTKEAEGAATLSRIIGEANSEKDRIINEATNNANRIAESIKNTAEQYADTLKTQTEKERQEIIDKAHADSAKIAADAENVMSSARAFADDCRTRAEADAQKIRDEAEKTISSIRNKLAEDRETLERKEQHIADEEKRIAFEKGRLDTREQDIEDEIKSRGWQFAQVTEAECERLRVSNNELHKLNQKINEQLGKFQKQATGIDEIDALKSELKEVKEALSAITSKGISANNVDEFVYAKNELDNIRTDNAQLHSDLSNYEQRLRTMNSGEKELSDLKEQKKYLEDMVNVLTERLNKNKQVSHAEMIAPIHEMPACLSKTVRTICPFDNENDWIENIKTKAYNERGLKFTERQIAAFHTAQKIHDMSPLVVLAGVSGTGKSKLPESYSYYGGMNFLNIPVKPDWDSPSSLFGYYNSIERRFEPTQLLKALYHMSENETSNEFSEQMLMVLLDEMNLAHPEQYFADLLSELEMNRGSNSAVSYDVILGGGQHETIKIGSNVLWTGTMNEDETTKGLSDKVIDRSTLITFPRPQELENGKDKQNISKAEFVLTKNQWLEWCDRVPLTNEAVIKEYLKECQINVQSINDKMSYMGRNIGHRVWQGMKRYMLHHPNVINAKNENELKDALYLAFCDSIAFKIMPKLRGVEVLGNNATKLDEIRKIIKNCADDLSDDFKKACELPTELFQWYSSDFMNK